MIRGNYIGKYVGKDGVCGLLHAVEYQIEVGKNEYTYELYASYDKMNERTVDITVNYASEISIRRNWTNLISAD